MRLKDGRAIGYGAAGPDDGRPVFFCHGTPGSRLDLHVGDTEALVAERGIRLYALERPGYGLSDPSPGRRVVDWADDVRQVADALNVERFAIYGYSAGGPHALACAAGLGDRVISVAAVSGVGMPGIPGEFDGMGPNERLLHRLTRVSPRLVSAVYRLVRRNAQRNPGRFFRDFEKDCSDSDRAVLADPGTREAFLATVREALRPGVQGAVDDWVVLNRRPWGFDPEEIGVPTVLIYGDADRMVPVTVGRDLARRIPHAQAIEVPGEGHLLIVHRMAQILDALAEVPRGDDAVAS
jgi:pimeloyl-ACP methyl ester carboxylesterase